MTQVQDHRRSYNRADWWFSLIYWSLVIFFVFATGSLFISLYNTYIDHWGQYSPFAHICSFLFFVLRLSQQIDFASAPCPAPLPLRTTPWQITLVSFFEKGFSSDPRVGQAFLASWPKKSLTIIIMTGAFGDLPSLFSSSGQDCSGALQLFFHSVSLFFIVYCLSLRRGYLDVILLH